MVAFELLKCIIYILRKIFKMYITLNLMLGYNSMTTLTILTNYKMLSDRVINNNDYNNFQIFVAMVPIYVVQIYYRGPKRNRQNIEDGFYLFLYFSYICTVFGFLADENVKSFFFVFAG